jgi:Uncharacterized conserved protein (DUF2190)
MADYVPVYSGGVVPFTATTSAAVTGGRVLAVSGDGTVAHAAAGSLVAVGVAAHDAASGAPVAVWPLDRVMHELSAPGVITAAAGVVTAAAGEVATAVVATASAAGTLIGVAATTASGNKLRVLGRH